MTASAIGSNAAIIAAAAARHRPADCGPASLRRQTRRWRWLFALAVGCAFAAQAEPPSALRAEYEVRRPDGKTKTLMFVRDEARIEYRLAGEPVRQWRRLGDGLSHRVIFPEDRRIVEYAPGDLRALGHMPEWTTIRSLIDPQLRTTLKPGRRGQAFDEASQRYAGERKGVPVELVWLQVSELPARYRQGRGRRAETLTLKRLERVPAATAFTDARGFRTLDYADLGDMERDAFARRFIEQGAVVTPHAH